MEKKVGKEGLLKAAVVGGKIRLSYDIEGADGDAGAYIASSPEQICNALADLIPGDTSAEKAALAVVRGALALAVAEEK